MRLCLRHLPEPFNTPEEWVAQLKKLGYRSGYCPVDENTPDSLVEEYVQAARENDIVICEVNSWSNPLSMDPKVKDAAIEFCIRRLELAERMGVRCCVNIAGSKGEQWDGPHKDNFTDRVFEEIVETVRKIVLAVDPKRTRYSLEPMPFMPPDTPQSYLDIVNAVDLPGFGVHVDVVNIITHPRLYYNNGVMIKEFFDKLSPYIDSCHIKDVRLTGKLTVHLEETCPGDGGLDIPTYLKCIDTLDPDTTLVVEHQPSAELYAKGAAYVRKVAGELGIEV